MTLSPLKRFLLAAVLWLPLAFFFWFWFASPLCWPVIQLAKSVLLHAWPTLFTAISQGADLIDTQGRVLGHPGYLMQISSGILVNAAPPGEPAKFGFLEPVVNPMIYGYALPLFAGLVLATPLTRLQRTAQIIGGGLVILVSQTVGVIGESLKTVALDSGAEGLKAVQQAGIPLNLIALWYQFGYLILPALVPAVLWIVLNRRFIETLIRPESAEPVPKVGVETQQSGVG
ncbi:MAG: exosortase H-associated membrane protein [Rudaea sp.]